MDATLKNKKQKSDNINPNILGKKIYYGICSIKNKINSSSPVYIKYFLFTVLKKAKNS